MKYYYNLISKFSEKSWEQLSDNEKDNLINSYIFFRSVRLPNTQPYKNALLALFKGDKSVSVDYIRSVVFQAIKSDIELDLDREWMYENDDDDNNDGGEDDYDDEDDYWLQQQSEQQEYEEYNNQQSAV